MYYQTWFDNDSSVGLKYSLADYFQLNWIDGNFAVDMWCHFQNGNLRTINAVEGWHNRINDYCLKLFFFNYIQCLKTRVCKNRGIPPVLDILINLF